MPCSFVIFIPYFISGIIFNEIYMRVRDLRVAIGIGVAALCVGLISVFTLYHNQSLLMFFQVRGMRAVWDAFWGLPFGLLCLGIALAPIRIISNPITCYLGKISYGLYLWHPVILLILGRLGFYKYLAAGFSGSDSLVFLFSFLSTLCLDIILATISYRLVEKPGMGLQKHCKAIFSKFNFSN